MTPSSTKRCKNKWWRAHWSRHFTQATRLSPRQVGIKVVERSKLIIRGGNLILDIENSNRDVCFKHVTSYATAFLFFIETETTVGYGTRSITENCPESILLLIAQASVCVSVQFIQPLVVHFFVTDDLQWINNLKQPHRNQNALFSVCLAPWSMRLWSAVFSLKFQSQRTGTIHLSSLKMP